MKKSDVMLGVLLAIIGLMMIIAPDQCIKVAVISLGLEAIINGAYNLLKMRQLVSDPTFQLAILIRGLISVVIGLLAIILPLRFAATMWTIMLYMLAFYLIAASIIELYAMTKLRTTGIDRKQYTIEVVISFIAALILFLIPQQIGLALIRVLGIILFIISGAYTLYEWKNRPIIIDEIEIIDESQ
ncbi:MAG: DUF308 domain-containing protein [Treponema sp.]|nr:DUF308 domain-containing protein [Treponema sp.]